MSLGLCPSPSTRVRPQRVPGRPGKALTSCSWLGGPSAHMTMRGQNRVFNTNRSETVHVDATHARAHGRACSRQSAPVHANMPVQGPWEILAAQSTRVSFYFAYTYLEMTLERVKFTAACSHTFRLHAVHAYMHCGNVGFHRPNTLSTRMKIGMHAECVLFYVTR